MPHGKVGHGPCDRVRDQDPLGELPDQQNEDTRCAGAQDFSDADFLGPLFGYEGGQAEKAETGNDDGQNRK